MSELGTVTFHGASKFSYDCDAWPLTTSFNEVGAVYVMTQHHSDAEGKYWHNVIYVGETDDLSARFDNHHKADCFEQAGVNCICTHRHDDQETRLDIEADLIASYDPPCNG